MRITAVDPGHKTTGWAKFVDGKLKYCGLARGKTHQQMLDQLEELREYVELAIIEIPKVYDRRRWKGDPNDLINVALSSGAAGMMLRNAKELKHVHPQAWKGQRPKDIDNTYTVSLLDEEELAVLRRVDCPESLIHNVIDAIGIGLWGAKRR